MVLKQRERGKIEASTLLCFAMHSKRKISFDSGYATFQSKTFSCSIGNFKSHNGHIFIKMKKYQHETATVLCNMCVFLNAREQCPVLNQVPLCFCSRTYCLSNWLLCLQHFPLVLLTKRPVGEESPSFYRMSEWKRDVCEGDRKSEWVFCI